MADLYFEAKLEEVGELQNNGSDITAEYSELPLAPFVPDAFDFAERFVDHRQTVLFQPLLVSKISFALLAYPIAEPQG